METLENLLAKINEYEKRMGIGQDDPARDGYLVLVKILRQQNEYLDRMSLSSMITDLDKSKAPEYDRAKALWVGLPDMIKSVTALKYELKMEGENTQQRKKPISAQQIAEMGDVL